jgi:hypothetical protein
MKLVLRAVLSRHELRPAGGAPETTRRRGITFSPSRGSRVILVPRAGAGATSPKVAHRVAAAA